MLRLSSGLELIGLKGYKVQGSVAQAVSGLGLWVRFGFCQCDRIL